MKKSLFGKQGVGGNKNVPLLIFEFISIDKKNKMKSFV